MSWLSKLGGFDSNPKKEIKTKAQELFNPMDNVYLTNLVRAMMYNGYDLNADNDSSSYVKDGYGANISIYSIINYVITTASNVTFKLQTKNSDGTWEDDADSEILRLMRKPNPLSTQSLFVEEALGWKILDGNQYIYAPRMEVGLNSGKTMELWVMPSTGMQVVGGGIRKPVQGYRYHEWEELIPVEDVMHMRYFNPVGAVDNLSGSLVGMSPLRAAVLAAKKSNSAAIAGVAAYENNGAMGIISSNANQFANFTKENAEDIAQAWKRDNGGANNYNKLAVTPGAVDFKRTNMSPADLRLAESELQSMRQIGGAIKFPTQLINDAEGATFSNQQEAQKSVYTNTIIPEMRLLGEGIAAWLGGAYYGDTEIRIIPDTTNIEVLQKDKATMATWLVNADFLTQNEKRTEMGYDADPDPSMDDYLLPNGKTFKQDLEIFNDFSERPDQGLPEA